MVHFSDGQIFYHKVKQAGCQQVYSWINKRSQGETLRRKEAIKILFEKFIAEEPSMVERAEQAMKEETKEEEKTVEE